MKCKVFSLTILILGITSQVFAQNQVLADSLIIYLENNTVRNDSTKYQLLYNISFNSSSPIESLYYAKKAREIAEKNNDFIRLGATHCLIGESYKAQGKLALALEEFIEGEKYYVAANSEDGQASVSSFIARIYSVQNEFQKAHFFYNKAISIFQEKNDTLRLGVVFQNKGNAFMKMQEYDSAKVYFHESLNLFNQINYALGRAYNLGHIGLLHASEGNFMQAEANLKDAIEILEKHGDSYAISDFSHQMADIYFKNGNVQEAFPLALKSLDLAKQDGLKEQARDACLQLSELYSYTKDYEQAYHHHSQYVAYRDSINNEEVIRKMADLRTEYEVSQKQTEIDLLTEQRKSNEKIGLALLCIALLFSVLAFLFYRNNRIKRSANKLLFAQNNKLELQQTKLEALNNTKDRFFSIISHDLRGPVNAFNGISELIKYYIAHNEMGQLREVSEHIDKSARQLSSLLNNLLDWSIKQQGTFPFRPERLTLTPLLQEIVDMFRIAAHAKNITITLDVEEEIHVWADRNSLATIVRNLFNNALKFTPKDGLVTLSAYTEENFLYINIIDTGVGIPEEKVQTLFMVKEKIIDLGTEGEKGLGIGLSLALEFAEMNGGSIIVNSEEGIGSIFTLKMPLNGTELTKAKAKETALPQSISEEKD